MNNSLTVLFAIAALAGCSSTGPERGSTPTAYSYCKTDANGVVCTNQIVAVATAASGTGHVYQVTLTDPFYTPDPDTAKTSVKVKWKFANQGPSAYFVRAAGDGVFVKGAFPPFDDDGDADDTAVKAMGHTLPPGVQNTFGYKVQGSGWGPFNYVLIFHVTTQLAGVQFIERVVCDPTIVDLNSFVFTDSGLQTLTCSAVPWKPLAN